MFEYYVAFVMGDDERHAGLTVELPFRIESGQQVDELVEALRAESNEEVVIPLNWKLLREIK